MPLSPNFNAASILGNPAAIVLNDTSTGSDADIKSRVVYLRKYDAAYITQTPSQSSVIIVNEVRAISYIGGVSLGTTGDVFLTQVNDPILGVISIGSYTQLIGDTLTTLITGIINSIINGGSGYSAENYSPTTLNIIAKVGLGATINGNNATISWASNASTNDFQDGVTQQSLPLTGQNYLYWPYASSTITYSNILTKDFALNVQVDWLSATGAVLYTKTILYVFQRYNIEFDFSLTYSESVGLASLNSTNWLNGRMALRLAINDADNAITESASITDSQKACDRGTYIRLNPNILY